MASPMIQRLSIVLIGIYEDSETILGVGYSKSFQNIFSDFVLFSAVLVVNTEVGKLIGKDETQNISKILYYSLLFTTLYSVFFALPCLLLLGGIMPSISNLSPEIGQLIFKITLGFLFPIYLTNINYSFSAYLQSVGLGAKLGRINIISQTISLILSIVVLFLTGRVLYFYYAIMWLTTCMQFSVNFYFYSFALTSSAKISSLKINWKIFCFVSRKMLNNSLVEILEFANVEITYISAAMILDQSENSALVLTISMYLMINNFFIAFKKLPYSAICEFLGLKKANLARYTFFHSFFLIFLISVGFFIPIVGLCYWGAQNSFSDDERARNYTIDAIWKTAYLSYSRICLCYILDIFKGLDMRVMGCFWAALSCLLTFIFNLLFMKFFESRTVSFLLGYYLPMVIISFLGILQLALMDWKKQLLKLDSIDE